jgi:predicted dehydrogenase
VDTLRFLGMEIEAAQASLQTIIDERPLENPLRRVTSDDCALVNLRIAGGAIAAMTFSAVASGPDEPAVLTIHGEDGALRLIGEELLTALRGEPFTLAAGDELAPRRGNSAGGGFGSGTYFLGLALRAALDNGDRSALAKAATFDDGLAHQRVLDAARASSANGGEGVGGTRHGRGSLPCLAPRRVTEGE